MDVDCNPSHHTGCLNAACEARREARRVCPGELQVLPAQTSGCSALSPLPRGCNPGARAVRGGARALGVRCALRALLSWPHLSLTPCHPRFILIYDQTQ